MVSQLMNENLWQEVPQFDFQDITYHRARHTGAVRIAFDRPEVRNAFRPQASEELFDALTHARQLTDVGCILITGNGPSPEDGEWAFSSGGDQSHRGEKGYKHEGQQFHERGSEIDRYPILDVQRRIRRMPKPVVAVVPGWAVGGGHSLHVVCDLTIASKEHAVFKQTDPDVGSFDGGFGSATLARQVGQKKAREIFFLGKSYSAKEAKQMGMVNEVVPHEELEDHALEWARRINSKSPTAMKFLKLSMNADMDGQTGQQQLVGEATRLFYMTEESQEGRDAFNENRAPDFDDTPWHY